MDDCEHENTIENYKNEIICQDCSEVLTTASSNIKLNKDWREYNNEDRLKKRRVGNKDSAKYYDNLSTMIDRNGNENVLNERQIKLNKKTKIRNNQNKMIAYQEIDRLVSRVKAAGETQKERACKLFDELFEENLVNHNLETTASSCVMHACRESSIAISFAELAEISKSEKNKIYKAYSHLVQNLDVSYEILYPVDFLPRFCSELGLDIEVEREAEEILEKAGQSNKDQTSRCCAAISLACEEIDVDVDREELAELAHCHSSTIRNHEKYLEEDLSE